jgi:predicted RNA binding protein with dsRBD fold (UPF0201 family)
MPERRRQEICSVSIRQLTSAYVSIRQHTSAYVSIREERVMPESRHQETCSAARQCLFKGHTERVHFKKKKQEAVGGIPNILGSIHPHLLDLTE